MMDAQQIEIWEQLLPKLKEFELVRGFQRLVLSVTRDGERLAAIFATFCMKAVTDLVHPRGSPILRL